jgi:uncharacterized protein (TIGR02145 family)
MKKKLLNLFGLVFFSINLSAQIFTIGNGVTDIDGNYYPTIIINGREWTETNLNVNHFNNGNSIPNVQVNADWYALTSAAYSYFNNDSANYAQYYGKIYNFYAVNDSRKLCPAGWNVPSDQEWKNLEMFLGMTQAQADNTSWRGTTEGTKLKSTIGWNSNGNGTNLSGINAFPGGRRNPNGNFSDLGNEAAFWTSTGQGSLPFQNAYDRRIMSIYEKIYRLGESVKGGFYVRCINSGTVNLHELPSHGINIFPNPSSDFIKVNLSENKIKSQILITNVLGQKIYSSEIKNNEFEINVSAWKDGIYLIYFDDKLTHKFIKK